MVDESVEDVMVAISDRVTDSISMLQVVGASLAHFRGVLEGLAASALPENPDPLMLVGEGDPNDPSSRPLGGFPISKMRQLVEHEGELSIVLAQQWVVSMFAAWDEELRPRLARATGIPARDLTTPVFGDLRRFRHDIVHNRGIASRRYSAQAEVLTWFSDGDRIVITGPRLLQFLDSLGGLVRTRYGF